MNQKGQITTYEERVRITERATSGQSSREISEAMGRPLATVRKWWQRYRQEGRVGLASQMGRPSNGALASTPAEMRMPCWSCEKNDLAGVRKH